MSYYGHKLYEVEGANSNIKITTPSDFYIMRAIMDAEESSHDLRSVTRTRRTTTIMFDLQEEYASLAQHLDIDWDALAGRHVLVTGARALSARCAPARCWNATA